MDEHDGLERRLRAMGEQPVEPSLQSAHLTAMVRVAPRHGLRPKLRAAGIFLAGLLVGGSGLAAAGALPDPAQHAAHRALGAVGVDVPDPDRYHGPECGAEVKRNHGGYVRDDHSLAGTDCGKKAHAGKDGDDPEGDEPEVGDDAGEGAGPNDACQGPPPWAGPNNTSLTPEEKAAAQAERQATCGDDQGEDVDAEEQDSATTTTPTTETTSTTAAPTTTSEVTTTTEAELTTSTSTDG
jgi:hypothetical protein